MNYTAVEIKIFGGEVAGLPYPNKAGLFEGIFFLGGGQFDPPSYFKKNNITIISISI